MLFVSKESDVYDWFITNEKYFLTTGTAVPTEVYVNNESVDFNSIALQNRMHGMDTSLE